MNSTHYMMFNVIFQCMHAYEGIIQYNNIQVVISIQFHQYIMIILRYILSIMMCCTWETMHAYTFSILIQEHQLQALLESWQQMVLYIIISLSFKRASTNKINVCTCMDQRFHTIYTSSNLHVYTVKMNGHFNLFWLSQFHASFLHH